MSCIKFPSSNNDLTKTSNKENIDDYVYANAQIVAAAHNVFGQGNWSHAVTNQNIDFIDYVAGKYHVGCASIVKVQLNNGTFHEEMGYSYLEGLSKGSAIHKVRLDSLNMAMRRALSCFGTEVTNMMKNSSRPLRTISPIPREEIAPKKIIHSEPSTSPVTNKMDTESFSETIPISQTDTLMGTVDLDQLFDKYPKVTNSNNLSKEIKNNISKLNNLSKEIKNNIPKPVTSTGVKTFIDKVKNSTGVNGIIKEIKIDAPTSASTSINSLTADKDTKINTVSGSRKETKIEVQKPVVYTAMTEEEMRLERKRKQREMQEEFKRKQEYKKMHVDSESKQPPNPRY